VEKVENPWIKLRWKELPHLIKLGAFLHLIRAEGSDKNRRKQLDPEETVFSVGLI
jgi:hypothetical protein